MTCGYQWRDLGAVVTCGRPATHRVRCQIAGREWCLVCAEHVIEWMRRRPQTEVLAA